MARVEKWPLDRPPPRRRACNCVFPAHRDRPNVDATRRPATCDANHAETNVMRKYIDCREFPSDMKCTVALSADSEKELLEAAVQHAVAVHGHQDTQDLRKELKTAFRDGMPPA
jgi:predicted small metal-binding protein